MKIDETEFNLNGKGMSIVVVFSQFNEKLGIELLKNTLETLKLHDVTNIEVVKVPGALEIPITAKHIAEKKKPDVIIALGMVIKGETTHFDHVSRESINGISQVSLETGTPIISGILTLNNIKQAMDRISKDKLNKGKEFAESAIQIMHTLKNIPK